MGTAYDGSAGSEASPATNEQLELKAGLPVLKPDGTGGVAVGIDGVGLYTVPLPGAEGGGATVVKGLTKPNILPQSRSIRNAVVPSLLRNHITGAA